METLYLEGRITFLPSVLQRWQTKCYSAELITSPFLRRQTKKTVTQFCPFSFIVPGMVQTLPKETGTVPFHSFVSMKRLLAHKGVHADGHAAYCLLRCSTLCWDKINANKEKGLFCPKEGNRCVHTHVYQSVCVLFKTLCAGHTLC